MNGVTTAIRSSVSSTSSVILVLANKSLNPSTQALPIVERLRYRGYDLLLGNSMDEFLAYPKAQLDCAEILLWIPPGDASILPSLCPNLPRLRWIHSWFAGIEPLQPFLKSHLLCDSQSVVNGPRKVLVTNARGAFSRSLAEWVFAMALHFEKQIPRIMKNTQEKVWDKFVMGELRGKTMGFVGFGDIAKTTARIAKAFGMRCIALKRSKPMESNEELKLADEIFLESNDNQRLEVFRQSDFVVCSLPGTPKTLKFVGTKELGAMRSHAIFISVGRGTVVDEEALIEALNSKRIGGAALDVFHQEPLPIASPLWECPNVVITAHNADWVESYGDCSLRVMEENLERFLKGATEQNHMVTPVDLEQGY